MPTIAGTARLVSDLHLRAERPDLTGRFAAFLDDTAASNVDTLLILGDLFEYWIGDDDLSQPFNADVCALLRGTVDRGTRICFMAGNRDFLVGEAFATAAGVRLLPETEKVGAGDTAILLMHGDTLCTDDLPYQEFRRMVRSAEWQRNFLARPLAERRAEVESLRRRSIMAKQEKTPALMDANPGAIRAALAGHGCSRMIHGHTHRPGHERIELGPGSAQRWVLSDWDTGRGDALEISPAGDIRRLDLSR
jgi:UDP-2,3-diacylglucosamine hydrolase